MNLINCDDLPTDPFRFFGGLTGAKICVSYDNNWYMLKRAESLRDKSYRNVEITYANDSISEYIGSHIYALFNVPVHETFLGTYDNRMCVLCKDLGTIVEFRQFRNSLMDADIIQHSSGMSTRLCDVFEVIDKHPLLDKEACYDRFWCMFVIDALIGNTDRNNGNWGFYRLGNSFILCPVYDCGGCLNNKRSTEQMLSDLTSDNTKSLALNYTLNFLNNKSKRINPFHYMRDYMNPYLQKWINKVSAVDIVNIADILKPLENLMAPERSLFYYKILSYRWEEIRKYRRE